MCAGTAGFFNQFVLSPLSENISITPSACQVKFSARVLLGLSVGRASRLLCVRSMLETLFYTNSKMHVPKTFEHFTTNTHRISQIFCHRNIPNINVIYCPFNLSRIIPGTWILFYYYWWLKSCTTWDVWKPINTGKNYLSTGAGFQPSTVLIHLAYKIWFFVQFWQGISNNIYLIIIICQYNSSFHNFLRHYKALFHILIILILFFILCYIFIYLNKIYLFTLFIYYFEKKKSNITIKFKLYGKIIPNNNI